MHRDLRWLLFCAGLALAACPDASTGSERRGSGGPMAMGTEPSLQRPRSRTLPGRAASPEGGWRAAVLALGRCALTETGIDQACAEGRAYLAYHQHHLLPRAPLGESARVRRVLDTLAHGQLRSDKPALRHWAAERLRRAVHRDATALPKLLAQAQREKHPVVRKALLRGVRAGWRRGAEYRSFVIAAASHPAAGVRQEAMLGLGAMKGDAQALRSLMEHMQRDPDVRVRATACRLAGVHADERLVPIYGRLISRAEPHRELYAACLLGLIELWNPFHGRKRLSRRAYALMLRVLRRRPYSAVHPPRKVLIQLGRVPRERTAAGKTLTPAWYRKGAMVAVLLGIALAPKAHRFGRADAIKALARLGAHKALEKIITRLESGADSDSRYLTVEARKRLSRNP